MTKAVSRKAKREYRHERVRKKVKGTPERPRLCVYKSSKYLYAQVIDDVEGKTLLSASTMEKELVAGVEGSAKTVDAAKKLGAAVAARAVEKGIKSVVFDRGGYPYHGRLKALAEAAREGGLEF